MHAAEAGHGDLGMITADDVIMALSWSGEQPEMKNLVNYSARFAIPMIAVTSNAASSLGQAADIVLELPKAREACPHNLAPTTSTLMQAAIGDALAIALLEGRGFTALEFAHFHPGGKLGAMLKFVRDYMHTGDGDPAQAARHQDVGRGDGDVAKGFGCVCIVDARGEARGHHHRRRSAPPHAAGPADGVGRRHHDQAAEDRAALDARQRNDRGAEHSKITTLVVTEADKVVGIVHLHDLLRAGVA